MTDGLITYEAERLFYKKQKENKMTEIEEAQVVSIADTTVAKIEMGLEEYKEQRVQFDGYVKDQMVKDEDYGVIPGCKKPSLYKVGAENMNKLFGYKTMMEMTNRVMDSGFTTEFQGKYDKKPRQINGYAEFTYKCSIGKYAGDGKFYVFAECEGSCNSMEAKFNSRSCYEMMNTLMKMAQKRAYVGATLLATGASKYFTQDIEDMDLTGNGPGSAQKPSDASKGSEPTTTPKRRPVGSSGPVTWESIKDVKLGFGKFGPKPGEGKEVFDYTWGDVACGSPGGQRVRYLEYMLGIKPKPDLKKKLELTLSKHKELNSSPSVEETDEQLAAREPDGGTQLAQVMLNRQWDKRAKEIFNQPFNKLNATDKVALLEIIEGEEKDTISHRNDDEAPEEN